MKNVEEQDSRSEAGLMESYFANAIQQEVRDRHLRFVYRIDSPIPINILIPKALDQGGGNLTTFRECITTMDGAVVKASLAHHPIYIKVRHQSSLREYAEETKPYSVRIFEK